MADNIQINQGTQTVMAADDISSVFYPRVKISVGANGVAADWQGTINTVAGLTNGSINILTGTVTSVTTVAAVTSVTNLAAGTVQTSIVPVMTTLSQGTLGTAGGSFFATLSAASGAGTKQYVTGVSVVGQSGTADIRILAGTVIQGTGVIGAGIVVPGGGYAYPISPPFQTGTNSELIYHFVGAGTAFIRVLYSKGT